MVSTIIKDSARRISEVNPSLSYAEIARLLGVSRERVRQVVGRPRRRPVHCRVCGARIKVMQSGVTQTAYRERYCGKCWKVEKERRRAEHRLHFTCEVCGKTFSRKAGAVRRQLRLGQRIRWCGRRCQGRWLAANYANRPRPFGTRTSA